MKDQIIEKDGQYLYYFKHNCLMHGYNLSLMLGKDEAKRLYDLEQTEEGKGIKIVKEYFPSNYMPYAAYTNNENFTKALQKVLQKN